MPNLRPTVTGIDTTLQRNIMIAASELFSVFDPDEGDSIEQFRFTDTSSAGNSGFFIFQGNVLANGATITIDAADLDELFYVAGSAVSKEEISIEASDGELFSLPELVTMYTARPESVRPVVDINTFTILGNESILASDFISASDPDGFPIVSYMIRDRAVDRSFFTLDGEEIAQGQFNTFTKAEFERLRYNAVGRRQENIDVFAFDGTVNSPFTTALINVRANLNRPVVDFASAISVQDELFPIIDLINISDADGSSIKTVELRDRNDKSFSGSLVFRGEDLAAKQFHSFTLEELEEVFFRGGERNINEQIRFFATDGRFRSFRNTILFENVATSGGDDAPGAGVPQLIADNLNESVSEQLNFISINDLVSQLDDGFPATSYEVIDTNDDPDSANLFINGQRLAAGVVHTFTDDQYENLLNIRTGTFDSRFFDEFYVRASNGTFNSDWTRLNVHTEPEYFEAFSKLQGSGATVPTWDLFIPRNGSDPLPITFSFMQQLPDYETGEAEEVPNRQPTPREFFQFTNAQKVATRQALNLIETFANVEFIEVVDSPLTIDPVSGNRGGTLRFGNYYRALDPMWGGADPAADDAGPGCAQVFGAGVTPESGDVWFNVDRGGLFPFYTNTEGAPAISSCDGFDFLGLPDVGPGTDEYSLLLAAIADAMGQGAPVDFPGPGDQNPILPDDTASDFFTVQLLTSVEPVTGYSLYDVNYFQEIYGRNNTFNDGDTTYSIDENLTFAAESRQTIWDAGGIDTISAVGSTIADVFVDLRPGFFSSIGSLEANLSIAFGAEIENAIGSAGDDILIGNELNNVITGGDGNDIIVANGGSDMLTGGTGNDTFGASIGDDEITINEMRLAGRDTLQFIPIANLDDFTEDISFRLDRRDLVIQLTLDGQNTSDTTVTIKDQIRGGSRVESLVFGSVRVDLENLTNQATGANQSFRITEESTIFGNLVAPV